MIHIYLCTKSFIFKNIVLRQSENKFNVGKTVTSGSSDEKKGAVDSGKKVTPGKGDARKGWKK